MVEDVNLSSLISDLILNTCSYCRLCLKEIEDSSFGFEESVIVDDEKMCFQTVSEIMSEILGFETQIEDAPSIDSICIVCLDKVLESARFIIQCKRSTEILNNVFDNLLNSLSAIDAVHSDNSRKLYITVKEHDPDLLLVDKTQEDIKQKDVVDDDGSSELTEDNEPRKKRTYNKRKLFECLECDEILNSFDELKSHNIRYHANLTCEKCLDQFPDEDQLESHLSNKHKYKCTVCSQYRSSEAVLKQHYERAHGTYVCKDCGKSCKGLEKLHQHEQSHYQLHECSQCGKKYRIRDFYLKHVKLCSQGLLDPHPERSTLEQSHSCEKCFKSYSTPGGLRVHMRFEHGNAKYLVCKHCGKKFTAPSYLKCHMIKHTGEKNFKCEICNNNFVSKQSLLYHTRRHSGEKPYSCKLCDEKFVNASARAEHKKFKHIGPQLQCEFCPRKFVTLDFLRKHTERHMDPNKACLNKWTDINNGTERSAKRMVIVSVGCFHTSDSADKQD